MSYNITSTNSGVVLSTGTQNPATVASGVYVTNTGVSHLGDAIYGSLGTAWTISNYGTVKVTGTSSSGIDLRNGGTVTNSAATALIRGYVDGIDIRSGAGSINNSGTVEASGVFGVVGTSGGGINLEAGGTITNGAGGLIRGAFRSIYAADNTNIVNYGEIIERIDTHGTGTTYIRNFGTLTSTDGVVQGKESTTISNSGTMLQDVGSTDAINLFSGGRVENSGLIENTLNGRAAIQVLSSAYITNASTGLISASTAGDAVIMNGAAGSVINDGSITGGNLGVWLIAGGTVNNFGSIAATDAGTGDGVVTGNQGTGTGTLLNNGQISAPNRGVGFDAGGYVSNASTGYISAGSRAVEISGQAGTVLNSGTIRGGLDGVFLSGAAGSVVNSGLIDGTNGSAIYVFNGGNVTNAVGANLIAADDGVLAHSGTTTVINAGTVKAFFGIHLSAGGGYVSNTVSGYISAPQAGVQVDSAAAAVVNAGTIFAFYGINLSGGGYAKNTGIISGTGNEINLRGGSSGTVVNGGTILGASNNGIFIGVDGTITNSAGALISATDGNAIFTNGQPATVINAGTAAAATGRGVRIDGGGLVSNASTGLIATGSTAHGAISVHYVPVTILNNGTIAGGGPGVYFQSGGYVHNSAGAVITGGSYGGGIAFVAGAATVVNDGTIVGTVNAAMSLGGGGNVSNSNTGTIQGPSYGIDVAAGAATIVNAGLIHATGGGKSVGILLGGGGTVLNSGTIQSDGSGNFSGAIDMLATGRVVNSAGGLISGNFDGIEGTSNADFVTNFGTITSHERGVVLFSGGTVVNGAATLTNSLISATNSVPTNGVDTGYGSAYVLNWGTIIGRSGVFGRNAVTIANHGLLSAGRRGVYLAGTAGTVTNLGTIEAYNGTGYGVLITLGGSVINDGLITGTYDGIRFGGNHPYGAAVGGTGTVFNTGSIIDTGAGGAGIGLDFGGYVSNSSTGIVAGVLDGVVGTGGLTTIINDGTILSTSANSDGIFLAAGGTVVNDGLAAQTVAGGTSGAGIYVSGAVGTVTNNGTVNHYVFGVLLGQGGVVTNHGTVSTTESNAVEVVRAAGTVFNDGRVTGGYAGVFFGYAGSTLTNAGTIGGAVRAVGFTGSNNRLIVEPGALFSGTVNGGGGSNDVLELAAGTTGTISASRYVGFDTTQIDAGASWVLTGTNTLAAGTTLLDFGTLTNLGTLLGTGGQLIVDPGTFVNSGYVNTTATLDGNSYLVNTATGTIVTGGAAVLGLNDPDFVLNAGSIIGTGSPGYGIQFFAGGTVTNASTGVISGARNDIQIQGGGGAVYNAGMLAGAVVAARLLDGGSVTNAVSGSISASLTGVEIDGTTGTVDNSGAIAGSGPASSAVYLTAGGYVINRSGGLLVGAVDGVAVGHGAGTVANYGTIDGVGTISGGIYLTSGGVVTNASGGLISGTTVGVEIAHSAGAVVNLGTITAGGTFGAGVYLAAGGSITNGSAVATGALIIGNSNALSIFNVAGSVTNFGTLAAVGAAGYGAVLSDGGTLTNSGTILETGFSGTAVRLGNGGILTNNGGALIAGGGGGAYVFGGAGTVINFGAIVSTNPASRDGVYLGGGGVVSNSNLIKGLDGVDLRLAGTVSNTGTIIGYGSGDVGGVFLGFTYSAGAFLVTNYGVITSTASGVRVDGAAAVNNSGAIETTGGGADADGVYIAGLGTVANTGTIRTPAAAGGAAVRFGQGGLLLNQAGVVSAYRTGVSIAGSGGTIVNYGTIASTGASAALAGPAAQLGAGGAIVNHGLIESVAAGAVAILGTDGATVDNFGTISGAAGTAVTLGGGADLVILEQGATVSGVVAGFALGDVLDFRAVPFAAGDRAAFDGSTLTVSGGGVSAAVSLAGVAAGSVFLLTDDGNGGTDAALVPASGFVVSAGEVLHIGAGETLTNVTVLAGGLLEVDSGGTAIATTVSSGGEELVESGGFDSGATILSGGFEDVFGSAAATVVANGGGQTVEAGGVATGANLDGLGLQVVLGVAIGTVVSGGDEQLVETGGVASATTVLSGGLLVVDAGGTASGGVISSGGQEQVLAGGADFGATISGGGVTQVFGSGAAGLVVSGGEELVESGGAASGTTISQGGLEKVLSGGATSDTLIAGGELELAAGCAAAGRIDFGGVVGTLRLDSLVTPAATIGGLVIGDVIALPLIGFAGSDTATLDAGNVLTVSGGGQSVRLQLDASAAGKGFALSDDGSGGVEVTLTSQAAATTLFDFVFIYNGGQDYYLGKVADDGTFGYAVGQQPTTAAGSYIIFGQETASSSSSPPAGSVFVGYYSHGGPGALSGIPVKTAAGLADGTAGLGSESDAILGLDGAGHAFGSTAPAFFATTALYGFVYTYADGAFYTGTVADSSSGGLPATRTVTDGAGQVLGVYTIFSQGVTSRAAGTVVVDRFTANGSSILTAHGSTGIDGTGGLGSEVGSVPVGQVAHAFSPSSEPVVTGNAPTGPAASTPAASDVVAAEVDRIYTDILGRFPSQSEFDTVGGELGGGGSSVTDLRAALAGSSEAAGDVAGLYRQVFGRAATTGELSDAAAALTGGASLASLQQQLANSSEAAGDINQIYHDVLGHAPDPSGLASFVAGLANETPSHLADPGGLAGLAGVRDILAHSGEAQGALTTLFHAVLGRDPGNAELVGMEDQLAQPGTTEATLQGALQGTGSAGGYTALAASGGTMTLNAATLPTLFQFSDVAFNDTITGFDAARDTIELPKTVAADFTTVTGDTTSASGGSLITFNPSQSIFIAGLPPAKLAPGNFLFS